VAGGSLSTRLALRRGAAARDVLVVAYHGVRPCPSGPLEISAAALAGHVRVLLASGYTLATFAEAVGWSSCRYGKVAALTFDDGDASVLEHALPLLAAAGAAGTVFVPSATVGIPGVLSWTQLEELKGAGWEIGSHGHTHRPFASLTAEELASEVRVSKALLEDELQVRCVSLAYPYGECDERSMQQVRDAGYEFACCHGERRRPSELAWPRVGIGPASEGLLVFLLKTSPLMRRVRATSAAPVVDSAGRLLFRRTRRRAIRRAAPPSAARFPAEEERLVREDSA
jgi:peptidoglycan/xylan/chitin deacetylase (PgdA/CDA1 family)